MGDTIGIIREGTLSWIMQRAEETDTLLGDFQPTVPIDISEPPVEGLHQIAVFYGGKLDESFYFVTTESMALKIADWVAEDCKRESDADADHAPWKVVLYDASNLDPTPVVAKFEGRGSDAEE